MYLLESSRRFPTPLAGFSAVDVSPTVKFFGAMVAGAGVLWLISKTKPGRKMLSGARRRRRR